MSLSITQQLRLHLRQQGTGLWLYRNFHSRLHVFRDFRHFGLLSGTRLRLGQAAMRRTATQLSPLKSSSDGLPVVFFTGNNYWYQTLFCAHSLARQHDSALNFTIIDDGTLTDRQGENIRSVLPGSDFRSSAEMLRRIEGMLPRAKFPLLHLTRDRNVIFRKLIDALCCIEKWHLYLDSDMLFFRSPSDFSTWWRNKTPIHMADHIETYIRPLSELQKLSPNKTVIPRLNGGLLGLSPDQIDWRHTEDWLNHFAPHERGFFAFDQTFASLLLATADANAADWKRYFILYTRDSRANREAALLHYINRAKYRYFTRDWRHHAGGDLPPDLK